MATVRDSYETICVVGLGYVGLPVALAMAKLFDTVGLESDAVRLQQLTRGFDATGASSTVTSDSRLRLSSSPPEALVGRSFVIVAIPTPIDAQKRPDLGPLTKATEQVGRHLGVGAVVVFESTGYPGLTEEVCVPLLERTSGLRCGRDFFVAYSPERINPGDPEHSFDKVVKVVAADDPVTLERVRKVYAGAVPAGVYLAPSIRVAEAAKVIENVQRDLNIALMNEFSVIFELLGIRTADVLETARTKWNFLPFVPGLVGGHCIGVDPYYLASKAEAAGYRPEVLLAGRRLNDEMGRFVARKAAKLASARGVCLSTARAGVLGITFKEDVRDHRNSRVPDIVRELREYGIECLVHDPMADAVEVERSYGLELSTWEQMRDLDIVIYAVPHAFYMASNLSVCVKPGGIFVDVKSRLSASEFADAGVSYWSL